MPSKIRRVSWVLPAAPDPPLREMSVPGETRTLMNGLSVSNPPPSVDTPNAQMAGGVVSWTTSHPGALPEPRARPFAIAHAP